MKRSFRKAISAFCAAAMLVSTLAVGSVSVFAKNTSYYLADNLALSGKVTASAGNNPVRINDGKASSGTWDPTIDPAVLPSIKVEWEESVTVEKIAFYVTGGTTSLTQNKPEYIQFKYDNGTGLTTITDGKDKNSGGIKVTRTSITGTKDDNVTSDIIFDKDYDPATGTPQNGTNCRIHASSQGMYLFTVELENPIETTQLCIDISQYFVDTKGNNQAFNVYELEVYAPAEKPAESVNIAPNGTPIVDSRGTNAACLNDESAKNAWMSSNDEKGKITYGGITWTSEQEIISAVIYWRDMNVSEFELQAMDDKGNWTKIDSATYTVSRPSSNPDIKDSKFEDATESRKCPIDTITFAKPVSLYGLRAYVETTDKRNFQMFEFEVYSSPAEEPVEVPTYTLKKNLVKSEMLSVAAGTSGDVTKLADGKVETGSVTAGAKKAVRVDLGEITDISKIVVYFTGSTDWTKISVKGSIADNPGTSDWNIEVNKKAEVITGANFVNEEGTTYAKTTDDEWQRWELTPKTTAGMKHIRVIASEGEFSIAEIEVYGVNADNFAATEQFESAAISGEDGLVDRLVVTNVGDASFDKDDVVQITYTVTRAGFDPVQKSELLTEAWSAIEMNLDGKPTEITAESLGAGKGQYVTGMIFYNLLPTDKIEVNFAKVDAPVEE